jgi:2-desacetyl-2-hydroxyethyl bacteriochlorophyllide A dehydrogenase
MPIELVLQGKRALALENYEEPPLGPGEVRAKAVLSAISHGTETSLYRGSSPFHHKRFDAHLRLFVESTEQQTYPARLGYEWVGQITDVGHEVQGYQAGDPVHLPLPHRQTHTFAPADWMRYGVTGPLPPTLRPEQAAFVASTSIALQAVHDAKIKVGDHVVIFGLGALGLLTVQLARLNGAQWIDVVDPIAPRRDLAEEFGANRTFDPTETDIGLALKSTGSGADTAIEFSGNYAALHQAIRSVRMAGLVVAAGFYRGAGGELSLGEEWLHNRVTMVASMRGWGNVPRGYPLWDRARTRQVAISLLESERLGTDALITHRIPFVRAQEAYELIDTGSPDILKVLLVY